VSIEAVLKHERSWHVEQADCLDWLRALPDDSVDLVMCSPPYEAARTYRIDFKLRGQEWVDWAVERFVECVRVSKGLVVWVVEGQTRDFRWTATPILLAADLHRKGIHLRKPPIYQRYGIPGSGGPDFWRNDYEFCITGSRGGPLAWSDNTACGHKPRFKTGGGMSNRHADGTRANGKARLEATTELRKGKESHEGYTTPVLANPGNVIWCGAVGGGHLGDSRAHLNEAPFPTKLVDSFIQCFAPPGGIVCDIFSGSGTTAAVALKWNRRFIGCDIRQSQVDLTKRRISELQPMLKELFG
jgi:hypothetical protein